MTRAFLTGASGSLGRYLAEELLGRDCELFVLVRRRGVDLPGVTAVRGDLCGPLPALPDVEVVVHSAATTEFGLPLEEARAINVEGTRRVLELAGALPSLQKFVHVSTAFVAGRRRGQVLETELTHDAGFVNGYDHSKYEAEQLVRAAARDLPVTIVRPSVVVDRRGSQSALWFTLGLIARGLLPVLPGSGDTPLDCITAADAAHACVDLALDPRARGCFHVAAGTRAPRLGDVVRAGAGRDIRYASCKRFERELGGLHPATAPLRSFAEILAYPKVFDTTWAEAALGRSPCETDPLEELAA